MAKEKCTGFLIFVVVIGAFGGFLFGYHAGIISGALIFLTKSFDLQIAEQSMVVSFLLLGALLGALIAGPLADRIGRRRSMALTAALFVVGGILLSVATTYSALLVGRFIAGIAVGSISLIAPLYLAEIAPPHFRGAIVSCYQLAVTIGILSSFIVNYAFSAEGNWHWMFGMGVIPALIQLLSILILPETPAWLLKQGKREIALSVLKKMRGDKEWKKHLSEMERSSNPHRLGRWKTLFKKPIGFVLLIGLGLSIAQQITGINTVIYYAPKIFESAGFTSAAGALFATLGLGIVNVLATIVSVKLLDKAGRRILLLVGTAGMAISLGFLSIAFFTSSALIDTIAIISLMSYLIFFAIGLGPVTWVLLSEIYPLKVRGKAMTLATFANWVFNYLVSLTFLDLITSLGAAGTFALFGAICALSFIFVFRYIPETKGKSLEEIEQELY
ncbi:MAG: sugar porter family MFS transporter [Verrucomicrobia bacterium]|nr:sugar porter family MFS transporter [Verrucomicrobiota bacterium]